MIRKSTIALGIFILFGSPPGFVSAQSIPAGGEFALNLETTVVIYGQRARRCGKAPSFNWTISNAITKKPRYGKLSDGGIGTRSSSTCGGATPVRIINYTPIAKKARKRAAKKKTNVIQDLVTFWGTDEAVLNISVE